jgi:geranylgeranyl pyrophosphate synthase
MRGKTPTDKAWGAALTRIEKQIHGRLTSDDAFVGRFLRHAAKGRGKRLRARLVLFSAAAAGGLSPRVERLASALELLHLATLAHDDVIDGAANRRHRPTLNVRFGNETAVLVGDLMFSQAMNLLIADMPTPISQIVARAVTQVCLGEIQETKFYKRPNLHPAHYLEMISNKTASLLAACCEAGAVVGKSTAREARALGEYGRAFGMAFQIQDDLLDITGEKKRVGKPVGLDLRAGRVTLPVIYGLRCQRPRVKQALRREIRRLAPRRRVLRQVLEASGALDRCRTLAQDYAEKAGRALNALPASGAKQELLRLVKFAVERDF